MTVRQHPVFDELCKQAAQRGMWPELTGGLHSVRVTDKNRRVLVERHIKNGAIDLAASVCLTYITSGARP